MDSVSVNHVWCVTRKNWYYDEFDSFVVVAPTETRRQHQDAASVHLNRDETTEDICRELRAAGLDPERMQARVREIIERIAGERRVR